MAPTEALRRVLAVLMKAGAVPLPAVQIEDGAADARRALRDEVLKQVPAFSASGNPDVLHQLDQHIGDHIEEIQRLLSGGVLGEFDFIKVQAQRRAEQRFPIEAMLHAYRCGHQVLSQWLRQCVVQSVPAGRENVIAAMADFAMEYTNSVSTVAAVEYVERARVLAEGEADQRTQLLSLLLSGYDESDGRVSRLLRRAGYLDQRQAFCVALAQSADPVEMENAARAQRIVEALCAAVAPLSVRVLAGVRDNVATAVFSDLRRASGWTAPRMDLTVRIRQQLEVLGPAVLIGLPNDHPSTAFIPRALQEAAVALDFADVDERVVQYAGVSVRRLLLHRGADTVRSAMPSWLPRFNEADARAQGTLLSTLRALADADLNMQQAARTLRVHPNTLYARLTRIRELTGLDAHHYHDLTEMLLSADCHAIGGQAR